MLEDDAARLQRIGEPQLKQVRAGHVFQRWVVMVPGLEDIWVFPKIGVPQNGWFRMEHPIKMDDLGVPLFLETSILWRCEVRHVYMIHPGRLTAGTYKSHMKRKEHDLNQTSRELCSILIFRGVYVLNCIYAGIYTYIIYTHTFGVLDEDIS